MHVALALFSIALSIGATAVVFTAVRAVLINPLPYSHPEQLVQIGTDLTNIPELSAGDVVFWNDTQEIARRTRTLESVGVYRNAIFDLAGDPAEPPESLYGLLITANLFPTLGVSPMLGRNILPEEDRLGHADVVILSYSLWVRRFNSDRGIVGRIAKFGSRDLTVIGVMPAGFDFPLHRPAAHLPSPHVQFWSPMSFGPHTTQGAVNAVARLRPGALLIQAQQDIASISAALAREFPAINGDRTLRISLLRDRAIGSSRNALLLLMACSLLFMSIGCANVANLLLARGMARRREISVRVALGAGRLRIVRQLLSESFVLSLIGGLFGYGLTFAAWKVLPAITPASIPRIDAAHADRTVLAFALGAAIVNGLLFGIIPAWRAVAFDGFNTRATVSEKRDQTRSSLLIAEVALAVLLVVIGGQLLGSFWKLTETDPGFEKDRILSSVLLPSPERYSTPESRALFYQRVLDRVRNLPGVQSAGTVDALPFSGENHPAYVGLEDSSASPRSAQFPAEIDVVSPEYLPAMGVRLLEGRWFYQEEATGQSNVAIIDAYAAVRLWPGSNAIGRRLCVWCTPQNPNNWKQVIGVVASNSHYALDEPPKANVYLASQALQRAQFLVVRAEHPNSDLAQAIRRAVAGIDPRQTVFITASMRELIADSIADRRFVMILLTSTAWLALAMAAAGVYGVISYSTSHRTQEIGVRMALGATPGQVLAMVFRQGFGIVTIGICVGFGASFIAIRILRTVLTGVDSHDAAPVAIAVALVAVTAALACWVPARRATRIDPLAALRQE